MQQRGDCLLLRGFPARDSSSSSPSQGGWKREDEDLNPERGGEGRRGGGALEENDDEGEDGRTRGKEEEDLKDGEAIESLERFLPHRERLSSSSLPLPPLPSSSSLPPLGCWERSADSLRVFDETITSEREETLLPRGRRARGRTLFSTRQLLLHFPSSFPAAVLTNWLWFSTRAYDDAGGAPRTSSTPSPKQEREEETAGSKDL